MLFYWFSLPTAFLTLWLKTKFQSPFSHFPHVDQRFTKFVSWSVSPYFGVSILAITLSVSKDLSLIFHLWIPFCKRFSMDYGGVSLTARGVERKHGRRRFKGWIGKNKLYYLSKLCTFKVVTSARYLHSNWLKGESNILPWTQWDFTFEETNIRWIISVNISVKQPVTFTWTADKNKRLPALNKNLEFLPFTGNITGTFFDSIFFLFCFFVVVFEDDEVLSIACCSCSSGGKEPIWVA